MAAEPLFSFNEYDKDGDLTEKGVYLHFGEVRIKVANSINDMDLFVKRIIHIRDELKENY